jgi:hypothetical protein
LILGFLMGYGRFKEKIFPVFRLSSGRPKTLDPAASTAAQLGSG